MRRFRRGQRAEFLQFGDGAFWVEAHPWGMPIRNGSAAVSEAGPARDHRQLSLANLHLPRTGPVGLALHIDPFEPTVIVTGVMRGGGDTPLYAGS